MGLPSPRGPELRRRQGGALEAQGQPYQAPTRPHLNQSRLQRPYLRSRSHSQGSRWCGFRGTLVTPTQTVEICSPRLEGPAAQRGPPARLGARSAGEAAAQRSSVASAQPAPPRHPEGETRPRVSLWSLRSCNAPNSRDAQQPRCPSTDDRWKNRGQSARGSVTGPGTDPEHGTLRERRRRARPRGV